ncbi:hypothetical protein CUC53_01005 [Aeromonas cavernicola]|uniref:Flagellar hook-length control protein-like C-terminal domain-containing protein n=2 Tax=Aeromonas cavernicola TaxID=1006623 RepID=A0A2H9U9H1_9GAMM|nr:hypothetical protein CUC53_01005 [Aeromonas cavernicola]
MLTGEFADNNLASEPVIRGERGECLVTGGKVNKVLSTSAHELSDDKHDDDNATNLFLLHLQDSLAQDTSLVSPRLVQHELPSDGNKLPLMQTVDLSDVELANDDSHIQEEAASLSNQATAVANHVVTTALSDVMPNGGDDLSEALSIEPPAIESAVVDTQSALSMGRATGPAELPKDNAPLRVALEFFDNMPSLEATSLSDKEPPQLQRTQSKSIQVLQESKPLAYSSISSMMGGAKEPVSEKSQVAPTSGLDILADIPPTLENDGVNSKENAPVEVSQQKLTKDVIKYALTESTPEVRLRSPASPEMTHETEEHIVNAGMDPSIDGKGDIESQRTIVSRGPAVSLMNTPPVIGNILVNDPVLAVSSSVFVQAQAHHAQAAMAAPSASIKLQGEAVIGEVFKDKLDIKQKMAELIKTGPSVESTSQIEQNQIIPPSAQTSPPASINSRELGPLEMMTRREPQGLPHLKLASSDAPAELHQRVNVMLADKLQQIEIQLDPIGLGKMKIQIQISADQQANVQFVVQHSQTREMLEQSMPRLRDMLAGQGIQLGQTHVQQQQQQQQQQQTFTGQGQHEQGRGHHGRDGHVDGASPSSLKHHVDSRLRSGIDYYA